MNDEEKRILKNLKTADTFDYSIIENLPVAKRGKGKTKRSFDYIAEPSAFDTETSTVIPAAVNFMYIWQFAVEGVVVLGRTWNEFRRFVTKMNSVLDGKRLVVYVHNLSYDFHYLTGVIEFDEVFCTGRRKVLKAVSGNIEFRCSMLLSGCTLDRFTSDMHVKHAKRKDLTNGGEMYNRIYTPNTPLPDDVLIYSVYDVLGLCEAVKEKMRLYGDDINTIPLTATGYVRREAKACMQMCDMRAIHRMQPDEEIYKELLAAFRGGNTHANRYYVGKVIDNVVSYDRASSYPDVIVNCKFPMSPFVKYDPSLDTIHKCIQQGGTALLIKIVLYPGFKTRNARESCAYLSVSKLEGYDHSKHKRNIEDNGRLLKLAQDTPVITTVTDVDFRIIEKQYTGKISIMSVWGATYDYLPLPFRRLVVDYFHKKTAFKGLEGKEFEYAKSKSMINSLYGMMVQKIARDVIEFSQDEDSEMWEILPPDYEGECEKNSKKGFLCYQWGVWVTAWARYRLQEVIDIVSKAGYDRFIYCDTDSVKFDAEDIDADKLLEAFNEARIRDDKRPSVMAYADDKHGITHYMGLFEFEGMYKQFITLGAKRYADISPKTGLIETTIAGVNKNCGACTLFLKGGLEAFQDGLLFEEAGKTASTYEDRPEQKTFEYNGEEIEIVPYILITKTTYNMTLSDDYGILINGLGLEKRQYTHAPR